MNSIQKKRRTSLRISRKRTPSKRKYYVVAGKSRRIAGEGDRNCSSLITAKLEALGSLIPAQTDKIDQLRKPYQLFQETADYIVLLRTQIVVLQRLVEFFGSRETDFGVS